uniref:DDE Tnp4 domain-containing protein n=1 Tax=Lactuca sativa TaxID=4236 RepID=A0A9R1XHA8_LACSA|nr:hypothetical protein LSAT_V11C400165520 [Lactuca sativa]
MSFKFDKIMKSFRRIMDENNTTNVDCETSLKMKKPKFGWDNRRKATSSFDKIGWENIQRRIKEKTGYSLEKKQLTNKWENMKKEWKLYDRLMRLETGLGGTRSLIDASPEWWEEKIKENKDYAKFRNTDLSIFDKKYAFLFRDSVAVGDQTMTPLQFQNNSNPNEENMEGKGDSDEINLDDDEPLFTSLNESSSSKRKRSKSVSNNRSTKSKNSIYEEKVDALLDAISSKSTQTYPQNNPSPTIADCMAIVIKFPDFREGSNNFSQALFVFTKKQNREAFMFPTTDEAKMEFLKMDSDDSNSSNDNEECVMEEDREFEMLCGLALKGIILARNLRTPCHTSDRTGRMFITEVLNGHRRRCYELFRLNVPVFRQLCLDLATNYGLQQSRKVSIEESVGIFLMTLAHGCSNRFVQEFFNHSGETIHRHFHTVLEAVLKLSADIIKPDANYNDDVPAYILNNPRYYPMFKDCIGAIDGTHVRASVPQKDEVKYIGRKGYATQNIMAVCDFNMCFTFVWAGWEGTAHDTRIFNEALQRPDLSFPYPTDKYYVVDAGYPNTRGYLAPYKGTNIRYHLPDFRRGHTAAIREPRGPKEKFNYLHSSLRNIIERTFGVWKARWALLRDMHVNYKYKNQVKIVIASMAIHNYIRKVGRFDEAFNRAQQESYNPVRGDTGSDVYEEGPSTRRTSNDDLYMAARRDIIAQDIITLRR